MRRVTCCYTALRLPVLTRKRVAERQVMYGVTWVNRPKGGEQLGEDEEVDGVQRKVHVARNLVALDGAAHAAALALLQLLAQFVEAGG